MEQIARCRVLYLGSAIPLQTSVGLDALQRPLAERYPVHHSDKIDGIDADLTVLSSGLKLNYRHDRSTVIWFPIQNLYICAAVRCITIENVATNEYENRFVSLDSPAANDPRARHPPMFAVILRRTTGVRVLECHSFICKSSESAMALVRSCMQAYENRDGWTDESIPTSVLQHSQASSNRSTDIDSHPNSLFNDHRNLAKSYNLLYKVPNFPQSKAVSPNDAARWPQHQGHARSRSVPVRLVPVVRDPRLLPPAQFSQLPVRYRRKLVKKFHRGFSPLRIANYRNDVTSEYDFRMTSTPLSHHQRSRSLNAFPMHSPAQWSQNTVRSERIKVTPRSVSPHSVHTNFSLAAPRSVGDRVSRRERHEQEIHRESAPVTNSYPIHSARVPNNHQFQMSPGPGPAILTTHPVPNGGGNNEVPPIQPGKKKKKKRSWFKRRSGNKDPPTPRDWYNEETRRLPNERAFANSIKNQRKQVNQPDDFLTAYQINSNGDDEYEATPPTNSRRPRQMRRGPPIERLKKDRQFFNNS